MFQFRSDWFFTKKIADEAGQGILILVLSMAALLWVVAVGGLMLSENLKMDNEALIADNEFIVLLSQINSMLRDELSCRNVLGEGGTTGRTQNLNIGTSAVTPLRIYEGKSNVVLFQGGTSSGTVFGKLRISRLEIGGTAAAATANLYTAPLIIHAKKLGFFFGVNSFGGSTYTNQGPDLTRNMYLTIRTSGAGASQPIISCTSLTFRTPGGVAPLPACAPGQGITSNGYTVMCVPVVCPDLPVPKTRALSTGPGSVNGVGCI